MIFTKLNELEQSLKTVSQTVQSNKTEYDTTITQIQADIKKILPKVDMTLSIENQIKEALKLLMSR